MPDLVTIPSYYNEAISRLTHQFVNRPRIYALIAAYMAQVQLLEDNMYAVFIERLIQNNPTGDLLDKLGEIVGQPRDGQLDPEYRIFITARIKTNRSDGHRETLIAITNLLINMSGPIKVREFQPKAVEIEVDNVPVNPFIIWHEFLEQAKAAGTNLKFFFSMTTSALTLKFGSVIPLAVTLTSTQRFGSVYVVGLGGGKLAGVF